MSRTVRRARYWYERAVADGASAVFVVVDRSYRQHLEAGEYLRWLRGSRCLSQYAADVCQPDRALPFQLRSAVDRLAPAGVGSVARTAISLRGSSLNRGEGGKPPL